MAEMTLRDALESVVAGEDLDVDSARCVMDQIMDGVATPAQIGALLAALRSKGESVDELTGFVESLRHHATLVELDVDAVDTCGTGGDGLGTFNISTAAAIVVSGAGVPVAKHGNRSVSSQCGSADVLEALGVTIALPADGVRRCVHEAGIGFMFAPLFHPALKNAAAARRELGIRTVFNVLGPLANPARVRRQMLGVADRKVAPKMADVLVRLGHERAFVVNGGDGMDELGLDRPAAMYDVQDGQVRNTTVDASHLGLASAPAAAICGGDVAACAQRVRDVLGGEDGAPRDVVLLNAAAALVVAGLASDLAEGIQRARESIDSGAARERLEKLVQTSADSAA
jgi:anthranilate phosphoribosyltransferase